MEHLPSIKEAIISGAISLAIIGGRLLYRVCFRCKIHRQCHRTWHADDAWVLASIIPLVGRIVCISFSWALDPMTENGVRGGWAKQAQPTPSRMLLIPSRIFYAGFLWCMKFAVLNFISRFLIAHPKTQRAGKALWFFLVISYLAVLLTTLLECHPLRIFWERDPTHQHACRKAVGQLLTMAALNIATDCALIVLPLQMLIQSKFSLLRKLQLSVLFGIGIALVIITIIRIVLTLESNVSQRSRSRWASIEIVVATLVANTAFYYSLVKDVQRGHQTTAERRLSQQACQQTMTAESGLSVGPTTPANVYRGHDFSEAISPDVESVVTPWGEALGEEGKKNMRANGIFWSDRYP